MRITTWLGVLLGLGLCSISAAQQPAPTNADEATLQKQGIPTDTAGLIAFFEKQSLKEGEEKHLESLVRKLSSDVYLVRDKAAKELISRGRVALPFLRSGLANSSVEAKHRAEMCIEKIEERTQAQPVSAAARVLVARKDPKSAAVLLNFVPSVSNDPFLEEEILSAVGRLTVSHEKVDSLILNSLKDSLSFRRGVAAYLIGRRGSAEHRAALRALLADPDPFVQARVLQGLYGKRPSQMIQDSIAGDEALLKGANIQASEEALLKYFQSKTLSPEKQQYFRSLVRRLGSSSFLVRDQATVQLTKEGSPVIAFLREAVHDPDMERSHRAQDALQRITEKTNPAIPVAAAHLLARPAQKKDQSPAEAIRTLLAYIPFADDDNVEEEVLTCLTLLCLREPKIEPELVDALNDPSITRRGAAAYVLGHVGTQEHVAKLPGLLNDPHPLVRLRAAQGLLAAHDKTALPTFVKLLEQAPQSHLPRVEEVLYRLAEDKGPSETLISGSIESRQKVAKAWSKWLQDNQDKIDLASLNDREAFLGLITVCEYDNQFGNIQGQAWESPRGGQQKRWSITNLQGAMDAQSLPNGNILIAENNSNRITERDPKGNIRWEYRTPLNPFRAQRLPNGNTFIASYNMVMEIDANKQELYRIPLGPQFYIFGAHKGRNGNIVVINARGANGGEIVEMDTKGTRVNSVNVQTQGNWCSVEMQSNGNYLFSTMVNNGVQNGVVKEIDRKGTELWSKGFPGVFRATKLPNGNVLVASMLNRQVAELDRAGNVRWSVTCQGRPWSVSYR